MSDLIVIPRPTIDGVPMTTARIEKVWTELVTVEGWPEDEALAAILRAVHFGLRQLGE